LAPFALYLLLIAIIPLVHAHFWEKNRNKLFVAAVVSLPVLAFLLGSHPGGAALLADSAREYVAFMALLGALFVTSGGIYLRGSLAGTPAVNTAFLAFGAMIASFVGTTGASVLLIRPLLRANRSRQRTAHLVVFFIFIVSNGAGLLTPLGDPPLFLGFLRGVPFTWTLRLWPVWLAVNGALLVLFNIVDRMFANREERQRPRSHVEDVRPLKRPIEIDGKLNIVWLLGVVGVIAAMGTVGQRMIAHHEMQAVVQVAALGIITALSLVTTNAEVHRHNGFTWAPVLEVAAIFVGVFVTMIPALKYLEVHGAALGITKTWQFFWATGTLSSFLDNAPTYLTFSSLAVSVVNQTTGASLAATNLAGLASHPVGESFLVAVSCGAVLMGAMTYIGNGPNFMVKAIAEQNGVRMPGFFGYMAWSVAVLVPLFVVVTFLFF
jgi:Na+/H+ antiporter NhaD/arsenite permease-like protein